jgi:two-component system phosphate regulon sensor histidine kinase PhoR
MSRDAIAASLPPLLERSPDGHLLVLGDGTIRHANPAAQALLAADEPALVGTPLARWLPELEVHFGVPLPPIETAMVSATGDRFPVEIAVVPAGEEPSGACWAVFRDISMRRGLEGSIRSHAEELEALFRARMRELDELRGRYRRLYDHAPVLDFELDSQGAVASANRKACVSLGVTIDRLVGVPLVDLAIPESRSDLAASLAAMREGASVPHETRLRGKDGVALDVVLHPLRPESNPRGGLRVVGLDVTARREAERQVDQSLDLAEAQRSRMERILRGIGEGLVVTDPDGQVRLMNAAAERILGLDERFAFGRDLLAEQLDAEFVRRWAEFTSGGGELAAAELRTGGAHGRTYSVIFSRIRTREGRPAACAAVMRDVSDARRADRETRELLADLAAELRAPAGALRRGLAAAPGPLAAEADRLAQMVEDFVAFARLESGRDQPAPGAGDPAAVVAEAVSGLEPLAAARGVALAIRTEGRGVAAVFDAGRTRRALDLLLRRALRVTPPGGRVEIESRGGGERTEIAVRDGGRPGDAEALRRALDRSAPPATARGASSAVLEIQLARHLAESQQGALVADGDAGGSTLRLRLPAPAPPEPRPARPAPPAPPFAADPLIDEPDDLPSAAGPSGFPAN